MENIVLQEDSQRLNEVIVVGYGTQKKATLTGAVASVRSEQIANRAASDATNLLTGIAPGLTAIQRSGQPGADGAEFIIRGPGIKYQRKYISWKNCRKIPQERFVRQKCLRR